jgi:hypothetical protein
MSSATQISQPKPPDVVSTTSHVAPVAPEPVAWRSWPLVDDFRFVWPLAALALALIVLVGFGTASVGNALFAATVLIVASWRIWMPVRYEVNSSGFVRSCLGRARRVSWAVVPRVEVLPNGFRLLSHPEPGLFDAWTAIFVPWGKHREQVLDVVRDQVKIVQFL